jgi:type VI secretion system protein ImpL
MKSILLKILKYTLIAAAVVVVLLLVFGLTMMLGWPLWVGVFILFGLLGLFIGLLVLRKVWIKRRENLFVNQVIAQDQYAISQMSSKEKERSRELQDRWKEAVDALKKSHLKRMGNPLYVLPWYMVIGESGTGKTTAIESARLSSPFAEVTRTSGISGTRNCDWWFFEKAILIDTAGRYAIPIDEGRDKEEWQKFLALLVKYRKKEPLNGLVVSIPADKLLQDSAERLTDDGRSIRQRIDELMAVLGARFPVYLLVTKCDLVQGMNQFCDHLPEASLDQAMGRINQDLTSDSQAFAERTFNSIGERLRNMRLIMAHNPGRDRSSTAAAEGADPGMLLFPEEFERLEPGLQAFIKGAFAENPYQETPLMRGIFFSSGRQEGSPYSHFLKQLGLIEERDVLPGTNKGLFLHDFFSRILPRDREIFTPTQQALSWSRLTKNLGLTAWVAVGLAVCGLLSYAFVKNLWTLNDIGREFPSPPVLQGEILTDMAILDRYRLAISKVSQKNQGWWIPRFGLNQSSEVEIRLKKTFCEQFNEVFQKNFDKNLASQIAKFSGDTPAEVYGYYVPILVRRINLLKSRLEDRDISELQQMPQPTFEFLSRSSLEKKPPEDLLKRFKSLYLYYLLWQPDRNRLNEELNNLQTYLKHILDLKDANLRWLVEWVSQDETLQNVTLDRYWGEINPSQKPVIVPGAFTLAGQEKIDGLVREIESSLYDPLLVVNKQEEFNRWYQKQYLDSWQTFAGQFKTGADRLKDHQARERAAATIADDKGAYFAFLQEMTDNLRPIYENPSDKEAVPSWLHLLYALENAKVQAASEAAIEKQGSLLAKTTKKGKTLLGKLEKKTGVGKDSDLLASKLAAGRAFYDYQTALSEIAAATISKEAAYQLAAETFNSSPTGGKSPFFRSQNAVKRLQTAFAAVSKQERLFWNLISGPEDFLANYIGNETGCQLQTVWENEVLVEIQGVSDQLNIQQFMFGDEGYALKYAKGPAGPFIGRSLSKGYYAKRVFGLQIPFEKDFLSYLSRGARSARPIKTSYEVTFRAQPTSVNRGARILPHATRLELECAESTQTLINRQYPIKKTFVWSPQSCGNVLLEIEVGNLILSRKYTGYQAFGKFLMDFSTGQKTFKSTDFPNQRAALERLGIDTITVKYDISGHKQVISTMRASPGRVPRKIVACWEK